MTSQILEIRTYRLVPGTRERLHEIMANGPIPALARYGITVLDYGPSLIDEDGQEGYYLIRAFASLSDREQREGAFYGGQEWRQKWREDVLACIEHFHTVVLETDSQAVAGLTRGR